MGTSVCDLSSTNHLNNFGEDDVFSVGLGEGKLLLWILHCLVGRQWLIFYVRRCGVFGSFDTLPHVFVGQAIGSA